VFASTSAGTETYDMSRGVIEASRLAFDSDTQYLLPPLTEVTVSFARPNTGGAQTFIDLSAGFDATTVLTDVVLFALSNLEVDGAFDGVLANAAAQALYSCAGKDFALEQRWVDDAPAIVSSAVRTIVECGAKFAVRSGDTGSVREVFENVVLRDTFASDPDRVQTTTKLLAGADRWATRFAGIGTAMTVTDVGFVTADLVQMIIIRDTSGLPEFGILAQGTTSALGDWTPSCRDLATDSNQMYRNTAGQDEFSDPSKELTEYEGWNQAIQTAITPLQTCSPEYRQQLANQIRNDWVDPNAARSIADLLDSSDLTTAADSDRSIDETPLLRELVAATLDTTESGQSRISALCVVATRLATEVLDWSGDAYVPTIKVTAGIGNETELGGVFVVSGISGYTPVHLAVVDRNLDLISGPD